MARRAFFHFFSWSLLFCISLQKVTFSSFERNIRRRGGHFAPRGQADRTRSSGNLIFPVLFSSFCFPRLQGVTDQIGFVFFGVSVKDWEIWHIGDKRWFSPSLVPQALGCLRLSLSLSSVSGIYCLRNNGFLNHGDRSIGTTGRCIVSTRYWLQRTQSPTRPRPFISKL